MAVTFKVAHRYANTRQIVDHRTMREAEAGGLRARLALRGEIYTPEPAGAVDLRAWESAGRPGEEGGQGYSACGSAKG